MALRTFTLMLDGETWGAILDSMRNRYIASKAEASRRFNADLKARLQAQADLAERQYDELLAALEQAVAEMDEEHEHDGKCGDQHKLED